MQKSGIAVFGILAVLMLVVFTSGCINNETLLYQYNLTAGQGPNFVGVQNVTIPNGTSTVKIVGQDLTKLNSNITVSNVIILILNTIPVSGATGANYTVNILEQKTINLANETQPQNVTYTFNNTNIKGLLITNTNAKGVIQIYTS
ncbi:hypothetical protein [Methanobacterium oryzae]|uniref:hypothetical protein n=1 Tax=Methanobacterium oryzae TaxID=69540 RepID=UPI003D252345